MGSRGQVSVASVQSLGPQKARKRQSVETGVNYSRSQKVGNPIASILKSNA